MRQAPPKNLRYLNTGPWPVFIGFTTCEKAFKAEMKRLGIKEVSFFAHENAHATVHHFTSGEQNIWLITMFPYSRKRSREQYAGLIAHEAMHIIQAMQDELAGGKSLGVEAEAYLMQQIVQECLQMAWASPMVRRTEPVT